MSSLSIIIDYVTSGEIIGLELSAPNAVPRFRQCLGATEPSEAAPDTIRSLYGENILRNVAHGCNTVEESTQVWLKLHFVYGFVTDEPHLIKFISLLQILELFFGYEKGLPRIPFRATFKDCTCCIIKPHVVIDGNVGAIHEQICTSGLFYISAMAMFSVKLCNALEFYEVYKGVLPEYEVKYFKST